MTHQVDSPWERTVKKAKAVNKGLLPRNTDIDRELIQEHFSEQLDQHLQAAH